MGFITHIMRVWVSGAGAQLVWNGLSGGSGCALVFIRIRGWVISHQQVGAAVSIHEVHM